MVNSLGGFPRFGEIRFAELPMIGSVQGGLRPVLVVQNDMGNQHSSTIEVLPLSTKVLKGSYLPTHVFISPNQDNGLRRDSIILAENVLTIPQELLRHCLGTVDEATLKNVAVARSVQSPLPYSQAE